MNTVPGAILIGDALISHLRILVTILPSKPIHPQLHAVKAKHLYAIRSSEFNKKRRGMFYLNELY